MEGAAAAVVVARAEATSEAVRTEGLVVVVPEVAQKARAVEVTGLVAAARARTAAARAVTVAAKAVMAEAGVEVERHS